MDADTGQVLWGTTAPTAADGVPITNALGGRTLDPRLEYDPTADVPRLIYRRGASVPFLPTFGLRFRF